MADRLGAEALAQIPGALKDRQFTLRMFGIAGPRHAQRSRIALLLHQQRALGGLIELGVTGRQASLSQQLGHHQFVLVRALAQVDGGQVKAKDLDRPDQRVQPLRRQGCAMVRLQRGLNGAQIHQKLGCTAIGVLWRHGMARRVTAGQRLE